MKHVTIGKKSSFVAGVMLLALFAGCSESNTKPNQHTSVAKPTISSVALSTTTGTPVPAVSSSPEISDEAFEKAFTKYLKENPLKFGKQLDEAYKIYQEDLQKKRAAEQAKKEKERDEKIKHIRGISSDDHVKGNKDAQFVLFEYSDYHCPFCKRFHGTTEEFLKKNADVALVFRPYPAVHRTTSQPLHEVAECIAKEDGNDAFWRFTDSVFTTQFLKKDIEAKLSELKIGHKDAIMKCYNDGKFKTLVDKSVEEATELGIQGTPGSILKNRKTGKVKFINGAQSLDFLESAKEELSK